MPRVVSAATLNLALPARSALTAATPYVGLLLQRLKAQPASPQDPACQASSPNGLGPCEQQPFSLSGQLDSACLGFFPRAVNLVIFSRVDRFAEKPLNIMHIITS
ncbi:hypothetical protein VPH35_045034 [Triticum aestivum]